MITREAEKISDERGSKIQFVVVDEDRIAELYRSHMAKPT